jgi:hypothetical protein
MEGAPAPEAERRRVWGTLTVCDLSVRDDRREATGLHAAQKETPAGPGIEA